jgi:hypothetical protein
MATKLPPRKPVKEKPHRPQVVPVAFDDTEADGLPQHLRFKFKKWGKR